MSGGSAIESQKHGGNCKKKMGDAAMMIESCSRGQPSRMSSKELTRPVQRSGAAMGAGISALTLSTRKIHSSLMPFYHHDPSHKSKPIKVLLADVSYHWRPIATLKTCISGSRFNSYFRVAALCPLHDHTTVYTPAD